MELAETAQGRGSRRSDGRVLVVFLTHNYPRRQGDLPGAFLHSLARALRDRGHEVRVVAPSDAGQGGTDTLDGIPVRRVRYGTAQQESLAYTGTMQDAIRSVPGLLALRRLIRALREAARNEASRRLGGIVHAHWWFPAGFAAPAELPAVVTLHGTDGRLLRERWMARRVGRGVLGRARVVTAVSPELATVAEEVSGRADILSHVQAMPVDAARWPWSRGGGGLIVVARLTEQKRVHLAIQAAGALAAHGLDLPLTIVGEGPERGALERAAAGQPKIRFLGALPHAEVLKLLEDADAMLFPARQEGFGLAAIEALMMGVPVLVCQDGGGLVSALSRYGGGVIREVTDWERGEGTREVLGQALRDQAREAGERWREELSPVRVAARFEGWYGEALAR